MDVEGNSGGGGGGGGLTLRAMIRSHKTNVCRRALWQLHFLRFTEQIGTQSGILW